MFTADQNMGLVKQVAESQLQTMVSRLTKTFVTLSLSELANRVGLKTPQEAESLVFNMIEKGTIQAKISQKDGECTQDKVKQCVVKSLARQN